MNKKLLALLVLGAAAGQTAQAVDVKGKFTGFFKGANALLNPIDRTKDTHTDAVSAKYDVALANSKLLVRENGVIGTKDDQKNFVAEANLNIDNYVLVTDISGTQYCVNKAANGNAKIDDTNGFEITTAAAQDVSVAAQGWAKLDTFKNAQGADRKTSEAIWGFRQAVLGKAKAGVLISAGWIVTVGSYLLGRAMAKAEDDEDEDEEDNA